MMDASRIENTFATLFLMQAELARLHYELAEAVSKIEGLPDDEKASMILGIEQSKQTMQKLRAFADDLQR